jgi:hypothetical protein
MLFRLNKLNNLATTAAILISALVPQVTTASSNEYALPRVINVGILRLPSSGQSGPSPTGALLAPYIFDILNNRPDVKPPLWKLVNPLAPSTVTGEIGSRYPYVLANGVPMYFQGEQITSNMAPYWEVDLSKVATAASLAQFNLLYVRTNGRIAYTLAQRQLLRQYVDQGGTLWIDGSNGASIDPSDIFRTTFGGVGGALQPSSSYHPVANSPFAFSNTSLANLGYGSANSPVILSQLGGVADDTLFQNIGPSIVAGDYGAGHVIIDGLGIGDVINAEGESNTIEANLPNPNGAYLTPSATDETNYVGSPAPDLQFLVNVISYATSSPNSFADARGQNSQGGNLAGSLAASWQEIPANPSTPTGVATFGKFVYTADISGALNCFDANPSESIFPDAINGDDGMPDYANGYSYDAIWSVPGAGSGALSAPVVALLPISPTGSVEVVMVQNTSGDVSIYNATADPGAGTSYVTPSPIATLAGSGGTFSGTPPGPTYYRGQILVPEPNGALDVFTTPLSTTSNTPVTLNIAGSGTWSQAPLVASIPSTDGTYNGDEIVAYAVYLNGIQTLELGSRDEQLHFPGGNVTVASSPYQTHLAGLPGMANAPLIGAPEDVTNTANGNFILDFNSDNAGNVFNFAALAPFTAGALTVQTPVETLYADYNAVLSTTSIPIRTAVPAAPAAGGGNGAVAGAAIGPDNVVYMTVDEGAGVGAYIEAVNEQAPENNNSSILWRFELVGTYTQATNSYDTVDASGIAYDFKGYQFVGGPVIGNGGVVFALATNGTNTRLMAFNTTPQIGFASPFGQIYSVTQTDEFGQTEQIAPNQYNGDLFVNFSPSRQATLQPSLFAPGTVMVTQGSNTNGSQAAVGAPVPVAVNTAFNGATPMLEWYAQIAGAATSPPRMVGDYIYFGVAGATTPAIPSSIVAVLANPGRIGLTGDPITRRISENADYRFVQLVPTRLGNQITLAAGTDKYLVVGEQGGFEGLAYNNILVADGNRLIEFDPSGNATWTMDATQEPSTVGAAVNSLAQPITPDSQTSVPLNRPSTVTQLNANDYLIADTGNNRCVHADRTGKVLTSFADSNGNILNAGTPVYLGSGAVAQPISYTAFRSLEIGTFIDPIGVLPTGQPLTLNHPNSVVTWLTYEYNVLNPPVGTYATYIDAHYLISDTDNNRLVDVVDRYTDSVDGAGKQTNEYYIANPTDFNYVDWVSHTTDVAGRSLKYIGAEPVLQTGLAPAPPVEYPNAPSAGNAPLAEVNQATAIIGMVGDRNISGIDPAQPSDLPAVSQDSTGSTILLLNFSNGYPYSSDSMNAGFKTGLPTELINSVAYGSSSAATPAYYPLRGLRSAIANSYTPGFVYVPGAASQSPSSLGSLLIADQDGVFYGTYAAPGKTNITTNAAYLLDATYGSQSVGWAFVSTDYQNIVGQYNNAQLALNPTGTYVNYVNTGFNPASAIELSGNNYLIVNTGGTGNPISPVQPGNGALDNGFGGNAFIVHATVSNVAAPTDLLDGPIYGHPANSGALSAPAFALRSN